MEQPIFKAGSEKRFSEFIAGLGKEKLALVSHTDLDGIAAAKVANAVLGADYVRFVNYEQLNLELVEALKKEKVKKVVFTDLFIKNKGFLEELGKFAEVLIIDHHLFGEDLNSDKIVFLNAQGYCATYLCYYLFSKVQDISYLDWLVACASLADWQYFQNQGFMKEVYERYGDRAFVADPERIKSGKLWDLQWTLSLALIYFKDSLRNVFDSLGKEFGEIGDLGKHAGEVQLELDRLLGLFEKEKEEIQGGWLFVLPESRFSLSSLVSTIVSSQRKGETIVILRSDGKYYHVSSRRQDGGVDLNEWMQIVLKGLADASGGGHKKAAGGRILVGDLEAFKR